MCCTTGGVDEGLLGFMGGPMGPRFVFTGDIFSPERLNSSSTSFEVSRDSGLSLLLFHGLDFLCWSDEAIDEGATPYQQTKNRSVQELTELHKLWDELDYIRVYNEIRVCNTPTWCTAF